MAEVPDTVDDAIDAVDTPDTDEVLDVTRGFSSREIASSAVARAGAGGGGGAQPQTQTATVTTDANTFIAAHVFDLGRLAVAQYKFTVTALVADGETFGAGAGQIGVGFTGLSAPGVSVSFDNVLYLAQGSLISPGFSVVAASGFAAAIDQFEVAATTVPRYLRVGVGIFDNDTFDTYAGANHPTATVRCDLTYL